MSNLNKKYSFIIFFIVIVFNIIIANNNRLRIINADYLESNETPNGIVQKLSGNVVLETDKIRLFPQKNSLIDFTQLFLKSSRSI